MTDDELDRDVAKALADRRAAPSRDLEARLLRATKLAPARRSLAPIVAAATVAVLVIVVAVLGLSRPPAGDDTREPVIMPAPLPAGPTPQPSPRPTVTDPSDPLAAYQTVLDGTDKLQLTTAQRSQLRDVADELAKRRATIGSQREIAMIELRRETDRATPDPKKAAAILARVTDADAALRKAELEARIAARAILTDDQRARLNAPVAVTVKPKPAPSSAMLTIQTTPAGATVVVDGAEVGRAPLQLQLTAGHHRVEIWHPGYRSVVRELDLVDATMLQVVLDKAQKTVEPGILRIDTKPWATVYVDGKSVGVTPVKATLAPGRHVVKLVTDTGASQTRTVTIESGKVSVLVIDLSGDE